MRAARRLARWLLGAGLALSSPAAQAGPPVAVAATAAAERLERVAWVWIQPEGPRLPRGLSERIYARVDFVDGRVEYHYPTTGWSVAPADGAPVAAVSDRGEVRALAPGRATLRLAYLGRTAEAGQALQESLELRRRYLAPGSWLIASAQGVLGEHETRAGDFPAAERHLLGADSVFTATFGPDNPRTQTNLKRLVGLYEAWGHPDRLAAARARLAPAKP